jgi:hypothetical protein
MERAANKMDGEVALLKPNQNITRGDERALGFEDKISHISL